MHRFTAPAVVASLFLPVLAPGQNLPRSYQVPRAVTSMLSVHSAEAQELVLTPTSGEEIRLRLQFDGVIHTMQLRPYEIRSPNYRLLVDDGVEIVQVETPPSVTYRGELLGEPDSAVAASLVDGELRASMLSGGKAWAVQPLTDVQPGLLPGVHVIYEHADLEQTPFGCGVSGVSTFDPSLEPPRANAAEDSSHVITDIAIDADEPYYQHHGASVFAAQNEILSIMNAVDLIYNRDVGIVHRISTILVRTVPTYSSITTGLLSEFRSRWNALHDDIDRDVAHLFSGRPDPGGVIGVAYLNAICSDFRAYGVSWTLWDVNNFQKRVGLTSHELGHNWGANHCNGSSTCDIMCSSISGCGPNAEFGNDATAEIVAFRNSRPCLDADPLPTEAPTVATINPPTVTSFAPEQVTLTGDNLDMTTTLTVGGVSADFTIVGKNLLNFTPPSPFDIDAHQVEVSNSEGSDSISIDVVGVHPSFIDAPESVVPGVPVTYRVHTDRNWEGLLVFSLSSVPSEVPGVVSLDLGNNLTQVIPIPVTGNSQGVAEVVLTIPLGFPYFVQTYWQAVMFEDPGSLTLPLETSERVSIFTWFF